MKVLMLFLLTIIAFVYVSAETIQLKSVAEVMDALKKGEKVRMVVYYAKCQLISGNEIEDSSPDAIGGMDVGTFEYFAPNSVRNPKGFLAFSENSLIEHRSYGYVINYVKVRVYDDNKVQITAQYLKTDTHEAVMDESFYSMVNDGKNDKAAVYFYKTK